MEEHLEFFAQITAVFPNFDLMISYVLVNSFGFNSGHVDYKKKLEDLNEADCKRVGKSISYFLRKRKTADMAVSAWELHFVQMTTLKDEIGSFEEVSERSEGGD